MPLVVNLTLFTALIALGMNEFLNVFSLQRGFRNRLPEGNIFKLAVQSARWVVNYLSGFLQNGLFIDTLAGEVLFNAHEFNHAIIFSIYHFFFGSNITSRSNSITDALKWSRTAARSLVRAVPGCCGVISAG